MTHPTDAKFKPGDLVTHNSINPDNPHYDIEGTIKSVYTGVSKSGGDYAYNIQIMRDGIPSLTQVWGRHCRHSMFKYDPKQAGDTEEDI